MRRSTECGVAQLVVRQLAYRHFQPTRESRAIPDTARLFSDSGTKAAPLVGYGNRGCVILSVSYRNVSAALSLLDKVCNSIYSIV